MRNLTLSLSHIDLDGVFCQILLENKFPNTLCYNCNYNKIDEYLIILDDVLSHKEVSQLIVSDLSFNENQFKKLVDLSEKYCVPTFFIDHHPIDYSLPTSDIIIVHSVFEQH